MKNQQAFRGIRHRRPEALHDSYAGQSGGAQTKTVYLKKPFRERPDFAATSVNYDIMELVNGSELLYECGRPKAAPTMDWSVT